MKKKKTRKLFLARETLRRLDNVKGVAGGADTDDNSDCICASETCITCYPTTCIWACPVM